MIELSNVKKTYPLNGKDVLILKGISVFIGAGEFVSIMGPSGSGKSTLSAILGCLSTPTSGVFKLNGRDVTGMSSDELATLRNKSIGFIFQDFNLLPSLTALENVALPLVYGGLNARQRRDRALDCLAAVGLDTKAQNRPYQLSGGQKQRVAIARALVNHPSFLFADEPTGALDKKTGHEILSIMQRLNTLGHTVIQVTHSPNDALYSKRILHLVDGNIVREEAVEKPIIGTVTSEAGSAGNELLTRIWRVAQVAPVVGDRDLPAIKSLIAESNSRDAQVAASRAIIRWSKFDIEPSIEGLFQSGDWVVRAEIIKSLNLRSKELAIPYYMRALSDSNSWIRHTAMTELKELEQGDLSEEQQAKVVERLRDPDERVRASAIFIAGKWSVPGLKGFIDAALYDPDNRVRANAVECVTTHELQMDFLDRIEQISREDPNNRVRANAAMIVAKHNKTLAFEVAVSMATSPELLMRLSGAWLLGVIKNEGCNDLLLERLKIEQEEIVLNQIVRSLAKASRDQYPLSDQIGKVLLDHRERGA